MSKKQKNQYDKFVCNLFKWIINPVIKHGAKSNFWMFLGSINFWLLTKKFQDGLLYILTIL